jgi:peptide/nickel transport system substrate-binding protein
MFHSAQIQPGGDNFMNYANPELDKLIDTARRTIDEKQRIPLWQKTHEILHDDQPYTFEVTKLGLNPREEWYVPVGQQRQQTQQAISQ